jgi:peptidoglycan/xylan/chitin deacetylase (PgdA/CDA1 family)
MKQTVLNLLRATGAFAPFRMANRDKALILTYHRFSHTGDGGTTSARAFAEQLHYLTTHYRIVPLSTLAEYLSRGARLPAGTASIAIDDGYRDAYEIAFPILREYNAPATLFVVTEFLDRRIWLWTDKMRFLATHAGSENFNITINNPSLHTGLDDHKSRIEAASQINSALKQLPDDVKEGVILRIASSLGVELPDGPPDEYGPITWEQAREMDAAGFQIGSHTTTHPILTNVTDERLRRELCDSRSRLEAMLGRKVDLFCYPNGDYDERVSRAVRAAGYRSAVTVDAGLNEIASDMFRLRRVHTDNNLARFIQCTSGFEEIKNRLVYARRGAVAGQTH